MWPTSCLARLRCKALAAMHCESVDDAVSKLTGTRQAQKHLCLGVEQPCAISQPHWQVS